MQTNVIARLRRLFKLGALDWPGNSNPTVAVLLLVVLVVAITIVVEDVVVVVEWLALCQPG